MIDTLRADAMAEAATPNIDALAADGASVSRAWSAGTWTVPSVISLLTGAPIRQHGWDQPSARMGEYPPLPSMPTLATVLKGAGFSTHGLYANPYLAEDLGFDRGFDSWKRISDKVAADRVQKLVSQRWSDGERHLLYVHLLGPHSPLRPSPEAAARWSLDPSWTEPKIGFEIGVAKRNRKEGARDAYAAAYKAVIEDTDARVGAILDALGPHREDTMIVLTSDHGELLGEHNIAGHGTHVWEPLTNVPLIATHAGALPDALSTASIPALVTEVLEVEHDWPTAWDASAPLFAQREGLLAALDGDGRKAIWDREDALSVYDLNRDPAEGSPASDDGHFAALRASWEATVPAASAPGEADVSLDEATMKELEALGYVEGE